MTQHNLTRIISSQSILKAKVVLSSLTFPPPEVFLVLDGVCQCCHNLLLLESQDSEPFDQASQPVRSPLPLCVLVTLQQELQQVPYNPSGILLDGWD